MKKYFVNIRPRANGNHEVHNENCPELPTELNRKYIGMFSTCLSAVKEAGKYYQKADGCELCIPECHIR